MAKTNTKKLLGQARAALAAGDADYALVVLKDVVDAAPRDAPATRLFCQLLVRDGRPMDAIEHLTWHLAANPHAVEPAQLLSDLLSEYTPVNCRTLDPAGLQAAMAMKQVAPAPVARVAERLLIDAVDKDALAGDGGDAAFLEAFGPLETLLLSVLKAAPVTHPVLERGLTALRRHFLLEADDAAVLAHEDLALALVEQCWLNEFVWAVPTPEAFALEQIDWQRPVQRIVGAMYRPPERWLPAGADTQSIVPKTFRTLVDRRRKERFDMEKVDSQLGPAIDIADSTGVAVAAQYEESPYPRWTWAPAPPKGAARAHLDEIADPPLDHGTADHEAAGRWKTKRLRILVAGCGTGLQAVQSAQAYAPRADVLAVDISRASLRYAAMKARQHKVGNLRFRQADILNLPDFDPPFDQPFDLIESVGVLHHLADPFAGWRALLARLAPGGLMYVGLYSATARRALTALREKLGKDETDPGNPDTVRKIRARILASPASDVEKRLAESADFYTLSNARDLLFHVHEVPLELAAIRNFLDAEDLDFLAMDIRPHVAEAFEQAHPGAGVDDLDAWQAYEAANPDTFDGMYLFWVQKPA